MRLTYHQTARTDLAEAVRFYRGRSDALGSRFFEAVKRTLEAILTSPTNRRFVCADVRGCRVEDFPYTICYRVLPDRVRIYAFKHDSRHPDYWLGRLHD